MTEPVASLPHEFRADGIRLIAMPPGDSTFSVVPGRPLISVTLAPMACRIAIASDRLRERSLPPGAVCVLPAGAELRIVGESAHWALLMEVDPTVDGMAVTARLERPVDFEVDEGCRKAAADALPGIQAAVQDRLALETLGFGIARLALARAGLADDARLRAGRRNARVERVKDRIRADLADVPSLAALAVEIGISSTHLNRLFRAATGRAVWGFVGDERAAAARALLLGSELSLAEVALACGFHDQAHLTRTLKARTGLTPRALRAERGRIVQ